MAIEVCGGSPVRGELTVQGSKNAVLPMMAAAVLCPETTVIRHCPDILDVHAMAGVIRSMGGRADYADGCLVIRADEVKSDVIEEEMVGEIRASILFLGSVLARCRRVKIHQPGGCSIGRRPIDIHLAAFAQMGAAAEESGEFIRCACREKLTGAKIRLPFPSVGATENVLLAAVCAEGDTEIAGAAREPEIAELCDFLNAMGARVQGGGTSRIRIRGVEQLHGVTWDLGADRIVFLTHALFVAGCGGEAYLRMKEPVPREEERVLTALGCQVRADSEGIRISQQGAPHRIPYICTRPYPGYPTDGQSLLMAVLTKARGVSTIEEGIFENRFRMARQLRKLGADVDFVSSRARITGVTKLHSGTVRADDLRSGAGLLIAASMAEGVSEVRQSRYIDRGYERMEEQMRALGLRARRRRDA